MKKKVNLQRQIEEAKALAKFAKIIRDTRSVFEVQLPGHENKNYRVILKWIRTGKDYALQSECALNCGGAGWKDCMGNNHNICYHTIAAVMAVAKSHGAKVSFAATEDAAMRLVNIKTHANRLFSRQSLEYIWIVS